MSTFHARRRLVLAAFCLTAFLPATALAAPPAPPDFEENWFVVAMRDPSTGEYKQSGYMHNILKRVGDEVASETAMKFEINRAGAPITITVEQNSRETLEGKPLGFKSTQSWGVEPVNVSGTIAGEKVELIEEQYGVKKRSVYPFDPEVKFAWGQTLVQRERGLKPGTSFSIKTYEPTMRKDGPVEMTFKVLDDESVDVLGKPQVLHHLTTSMLLTQIPTTGPAEGAAAPGSLEIVSDLWVDDEANPVVTTLNVGPILQLKIYRTSKEDALKRGAPPEMFLDTMVRVNKRIGPDAKMTKLRLRMKPGIQAKLPTLPDTPAQSFERVNDREAVVTIRRLDWDKIRKAEDDSVKDPALEPYLAASSVCDAKDKKIVRLAKKAVRGKKTPAEKADALRRFVTDYITNKNMNVGFATASEVAHNRSGDCSEHAVLLAALARAAGLPARGVSGIVEVPAGSMMSAGENAFGYHMWTQVYIGGRWVDIDAALRQTECDTTRVAISLMPLGDEGLMNSVITLIPLLGQLEIEVVEVDK